MYIFLHISPSCPEDRAGRASPKYRHVARLRVGFKLCRVVRYRVFFNKKNSRQSSFPSARIASVKLRRGFLASPDFCRITEFLLYFFASLNFILCSTGCCLSNLYSTGCCISNLYSTGCCISTVIFSVLGAALVICRALGAALVIC